jgi:hypothetical protein
MMRFVFLMLASLLSWAGGAVADDWSTPPSGIAVILDGQRYDVQSLTGHAPWSTPPAGGGGEAGQGAPLMPVGPMSFAVMPWDLPRLAPLLNSFLASQDLKVPVQAAALGPNRQPTIRVDFGPCQLSSVWFPGLNTESEAAYKVGISVQPERFQFGSQAVALPEASTSGSSGPGSALDRGIFVNGFTASISGIEDCSGVMAIGAIEGGTPFSASQSGNVQQAGPFTTMPFAITAKGPTAEALADWMSRRLSGVNDVRSLAITVKNHAGAPMFTMTSSNVTPLSASCEWNANQGPGQAPGIRLLVAANGWSISGPGQTAIARPKTQLPYQTRPAIPIKR